MKIKKLDKRAVRKTRKLGDVVHLSDAELRKVVGGGSFEGGPEVDPETCAIHLYYPSDVLA